MNDGAELPFAVGVVGCGRMGRLHARTYAAMPGVKLIGVCDANQDRATGTAKEFGGQAFSRIEDLIEHVDAVTVAVPTQYHLDVAEPLLRAQIACLIEKPLAKDSIEARKIVELAAKHNAIIQVGHVERFNPAIRSMEKLGLQPRFIDVTRVSPMTFRGIDVGVVLDMMIHDIDIVLKLAACAVERVEAVGVNVIGQSEDICNARLTFVNGCVANLTTSRMALKTERRLRVYCPDMYVSVDYQKRTGIVARRGANTDVLRDVVGQLKRGEIADTSQLDYSQMVKLEDLKVEPTDPLRAQAEAFISAVVTGSAPVVSGRDGLAAIEVAERIVKCVAKT